MKPNTLSLVLFALLTYFVRTLGVEAVIPPPDGGYPNFTTAEGTNALKNLTTGAANTAVGWFSLFGDTTASFNTGVGAGTLLFNNGDSNTGVGVAALLSNTVGGNNTAVGVSALQANTGGNFNTATGVNALSSNTTGISNTATGLNALSSNTTGSANTAIGYQALFNNTGWFNTALGYGAGLSLTTGDSNICIGADVHGVAGESNTTRIGNIYASVASERAVYVNSDNKIGTLASSRRFKEEIKPIEKASEVLFALKPVSFRYKKEFDAGRAPMFGLIAEDVAQVDPDLVSRNEKGEVETVRYEQINAMLLNEFLKEHRKNKEQQATITRLQQDSAEQREQIEALTAGLQKVSAQLELGKPKPQMVLNDQ